MTEEKITIPVNKIHKMIKSTEGIERCPKKTAEVLGVYLDEMVDILAKKALTFAQNSGRGTIAPKDMILAIQQVKPDFTYTLE